MRVRITRFKNTEAWYSSKVGEEFEVVDYIPRSSEPYFKNHYQVRKNTHLVIDKDCCEIIKPELFNNLYQKLCY